MATIAIMWRADAKTLIGCQSQTKQIGKFKLSKQVLVILFFSKELKSKMSFMLALV